ncbi:mitochondrial ribosomal protein S14 [Dunaliella salina]|uniref:Mitochondrial ribosomal protein S14 n=1 Tax=Dunaliella salina TaxID=3046 RepID=A0ABQ7H8P1_DUNSA|nr:mitochondrial ribosomal protein S14 [Dunaliella salina]|eukprot:KAF5843228.1 mitochondrial ribosomal protein S14 [Dunaliella salina]
MSLKRIPGVAHALGCRSSHMVKDQIKRLTVQEHEVDRTLFKAMASDTSLPLDMRLQVQRLFETGMPRDAAPSRVKNRCVLTGRAHSTLRFARVSRIMVRQLAHYGLLPGISKASW